MILIGLTGLKRSGKDTVADRLVAEHGFVKVAYADPLRDMALALDPIVDLNNTGGEYRLSEAVTDLGWEEAKTYPEVRRTLQRLGTEVIRDHIDQDFWIDEMRLRIKDLWVNGFERIVITDCRFANEVTPVHDLDGTVIRVIRPGFEQSDGHASESADLPHDYVIHNQHTIATLHNLTDLVAGVLIERKNA